MIPLPHDLIVLEYQVERSAARYDSVFPLCAFCFGQSSIDHHKAPHVSRTLYIQNGQRETSYRRITDKSSNSDCPVMREPFGS